MNLQTLDHLFYKVHHLTNFEDPLHVVCMSQIMKFIYKNQAFFMFLNKIF